MLIIVYVIAIEKEEVAVCVFLETSSKKTQASERLNNSLRRLEVVQNPPSTQSIFKKYRPPPAVRPTLAMQMTHPKGSRGPKP